MCRIQRGIDSLKFELNSLEAFAGVDKCLYHFSVSDIRNRMHANIRTELLDDCLVDRAIEKYRLRIAELEQELETL